MTLPLHIGSCSLVFLERNYQAKNSVTNENRYYWCPPYSPRPISSFSRGWKYLRREKICKFAEAFIVLSNIDKTFEKKQLKKDCIGHSNLGNLLGAVNSWLRLCFLLQTLTSVDSQTSTGSRELTTMLWLVLQLEREFRPTRLGNWEVPKWLPQRPRARKTTTRIIANDRGHLLPGVSRPPQNPWGAYRGTWQLPNKISRNFGTPNCS